MPITLNMPVPQIAATDMPYLQPRTFSPTSSTKAYSKRNPGASYEFSLDAAKFLKG